MESGESEVKAVEWQRCSFIPIPIQDRGILCQDLPNFRVWIMYLFIFIPLLSVCITLVYLVIFLTLSAVV